MSVAKHRAEARKLHPILLAVAAVMAVLVIVGISASSRDHLAVAKPVRTSERPTPAPSTPAPVVISDPPAVPSVAPHVPIYYTVQPGDTLTAIGAYFHTKGYDPLYGWNVTVIGKDPNLIKPGQVLVVVQ